MVSNTVGNMLLANKLTLWVDHLSNMRSRFFTIIPGPI